MFFREQAMCQVAQMRIFGIFSILSGSRLKKFPEIFSASGYSSGGFHRLAQAVAAHPGMLGIGLAEDTGIIIYPGNRIEVIGFGHLLFLSVLRRFAARFFLDFNGLLTPFNGVLFFCVRFFFTLLVVLSVITNPSSVCRSPHGS